MLKIKFSQLQTPVKKSISLLVAALILVSAISCAFVFNNSLKVNAATVFDSENPTSYRELVNEDFTDGSYKEDDWNVAYKTAHVTSGLGLKVDNPTLTYTGTASYLSNYMAVSEKHTAVEQHISTEVSFSDDATGNGKQFVYLWGRVNLGENYNGTNRGLHNSSITGYYLRFSTTAGSPIVLFRKSATEHETSLMRVTGFTNHFASSLPGTYRVDMNITGNSPTVINVRLLKRTGSQDEGYQWIVVASNTYVDESGLQNASGTAAIAMDTNGCANAYINNFKYITTDVAEGAEDTYHYVQKTDVDSTGRLFAQMVTLDSSKTYKLTAYTANTDASVMERFWVEYYSKAGSYQGGNLHRVSINVPSVSVESGYFTASTATFCLNEYVASTGASDAENIDSVQWIGKGNRTRAIVGFRIDTSKNKVASLTNFELYEIDPETGARRGGNLIVNGDFKLGLYAWNDNQERVYTNYETGEVGDSLSGKQLVTCYTCSGKEEFDSMFGKVAVDLNNTYYKLTVDKKLNITYMGGSVTSGYGASNTETTSWRALTTKWFKDNYPEANINAKNAAVGSTGSHFALYNYGRIENHKTDLLFVDAAVNDKYLYNNAISGNTNPEAADSYNNSLRNLESLILNARKANPNIDIVLVITFDHWCLTETTLPALKAMNELSKKYLLPLIDLREPLKARAAQDGLAWNSEGLKPYRTDNPSDAYEQLYKTGDGVHPIDAGYKIFADYVKAQIGGYLDEAKAVPPTALVKHTNPETTISATIVKNPTVVTADKIPLSNGWTLTSSSFSSISNKFGSTYVSGTVETTTPGSTLTYTFTGTDFGIILLTGSSCGKIYVEIDGVPYKKGANSAFGDGIIDLYRTGNDHRTQIIMSDASNTEHTITIKALAGDNGNKIVIGGYYVNDTSSIKEPLDYVTDFASGNDAGWILSSAADITSGSLNIEGSSNQNSHLNNTAFYNANKTDQRIAIEFEVTASNKHKTPVVWARADQDVANDPSTITGYYAVYKNNGTVKLYKRYKEGNAYKEELIGNCGFVHADNRLYRFEIIVEGTNETKISVLTYKYSTDKSTCYFLYKNTFFDNTPDLQDEGMAGVAGAISSSSDDPVCKITLFEYTSTDGENSKTVYLQKPAGISPYITYGQVVALDPNKTYVFEGKTTETNLGLWVQYNTNSSSNGVQRIFANGGTISTADNWRRISCEFNINQWATANSGTAPYVDSNFSCGATNQVLTLVGFRMAHTSSLGYAELTIYEKNDPDKKNILVNADFKRGLYGWSDALNTTFLAVQMSLEGEVDSPASRVKLLSANADTYKSLFAVGDVDFDDGDNGNDGGNDNDDNTDTPGGGDGNDDPVSSRPVLNNVNSSLNYELSSDFVNGYGGKWITNSKVTANSDNLTVTGGAKPYDSVSLYGEAHTNQVVSLDYLNQGGISPIVWARAVRSDENDSATISGYYVLANGATPTLYKRTSDGKDTLIGTCGIHTDNRTFRLEIAVEGTAPTKITVTTYKYPAGKSDGAYALMLKKTFYDYTEELQTPGYGGFAVRENGKTATVTRFEYASCDGVGAGLSYIEKPASTNVSALAGQGIVIDPAKTYTLSARVSEANARLSVKYWSASNSLITISSSTGTISDVDGYRTVTYTLCLNDWATANNQPLPKIGDGYAEMAQVFVGFTTEGVSTYYYSDFKFVEDGNELNLFTNADLKMGMYGWSEAITNNKWAYYVGEFGNSAGAQNKLNVKYNVNKKDYDKIFKITSSEGSDVDYSAIDKFMLHLTGNAGYEFGKVGQMLQLQVGKTYVYSVDFGYDPRNSAEPIAFYHTVPDEKITPSTQTRKEFNWRLTKNGSRFTYTFTVPEEAYVNPDTGTATVFVGFSTGEPSNNCYFYDFDLYDKSDSSKTNLFVNPDFKKGFYGWMINSNYFYNSINSSIVIALGEYVRPGNDVALLPYDASKFELDDGTMIIPDIPSDVDYSTYNGKYMLHIPETVTATYGKIGQVLNFTPKTDYEFTMLFKYIRQNSVKPTVLFYKDDPYATTEEIIAKGYKDRHTYLSAIRDVASFEENIDNINCKITLTFKVPTEAWIAPDGTSPLFVGISTGEFEPICYFTDLCVNKVGSKENMFENADFKEGFYKWIVTYGYSIDPISTKNVFWTNGYTIAQILPIDESIFVNDTNDSLWDNNEWYKQFGEDDVIQSDVEKEENLVEQIVKKITIKGKLNLPATIALYGGIFVVVAGAIVVVIVLARKKRKQQN